MRGIYPHGTGGGPVAVESQTSQGPYLFEAAVSEIMEQEVLYRVVAHHQVDPAVVIEVHRRQRQGFGHGPTGGRVVHQHSRLPGNIGEAAVTVIAVE